jgi:hypothetical protein
MPDIYSTACDGMAGFRFGQGYQLRYMRELRGTHCSESRYPARTHPDTEGGAV